MDTALKNGHWQLLEQGISTNKIKIYKDAAQYKGETEVAVSCTQLSAHTPKEQNKIVDAWCSLFRSGQLPIKKLWITSRISQKIFDAICCQTQLEALWIKWGVYPEVAAIARLQDLKYLHLGGGASIPDLSMVSKLEKLIAFETNNLFKIHDYSFLCGLEQLVDLSIEGDPYSSMKPVKLKSLSFLNEMPQLVRLNLCMTRIEDHSYLPIAGLKNLQYLTLPKDRDLEKDIEKFQSYLVA